MKVFHHAFLLMDDQLLRNYTQNIDDLESSAGIQKVLQCHGSFSKVRRALFDVTLDIHIKIGHMPCLQA